MAHGVNEEGISPSGSTRAARAGTFARYGEAEMDSAMRSQVSAGGGTQKSGKRARTGSYVPAGRSLKQSDGSPTNSLFRFVNGREGKMVEIAMADLVEGEQAPFYERRVSDAYTNFTFTFHRKRFILSVRKRQPTGDGDGSFDDSTPSEGDAGSRD